MNTSVGNGGDGFASRIVSNADTTALYDIAFKDTGLVRNISCEAKTTNIDIIRIFYFRHNTTSDILVALNSSITQPIEE